MSKAKKKAQGQLYGQHSWKVDHQEFCHGGGTWWFDKHCTEWWKRMYRIIMFCRSALQTVWSDQRLPLLAIYFEFYQSSDLETQRWSHKAPAARAKALIEVPKASARAKAAKGKRCKSQPMSCKNEPLWISMCDYLTDVRMCSPQCSGNALIVLITWKYSARPLPSSLMFPL